LLEVSLYSLCTPFEVSQEVCRW